MAKAILVRSPFAYDADAVSNSTGLACLDESLTDQSGKDDADINTLVRRFGLTGHIPVLDRVPLQSDFVQLTDYHSALNALIAADETFMSLPADLRSRFDHDAGKFVEFCSNPDNRDELLNLGLIDKVVEPVPMKVEVVNKAEPAA